jgi:O-antigen/teichoic acid export membrane protein
VLGVTLGFAFGYALGGGLGVALGGMFAYLFLFPAYRRGWLYRRQRSYKVWRSGAKSPGAVLSLRRRGLSMPVPGKRVS